MVQKKYLRKGAECKVTFEVPANDEAETAAVVGDFNGWQPDALPMKLRKKDRTFTVTTNLQAGQAYQFRYLINGQEWVTDEGADGVIPSPFGQPNGVLEI